MVSPHPALQGRADVKCGEKCEYVDDIITTMTTQTTPYELIILMDQDYHDTV